MKQIVKKVKVFIQKLLDRRSTRLPDGMQEFEVWAQSLVDTYGFPDNPSVRFMFAAMVLNLGQTEAYKPKRFFALSGLAAASKEIAHAKMVALKEAQEAKVAAERDAASNALAIVPPSGSGNGQVQ